MPTKSKSAFRFFKMLEHNKELAKEKGISQEKAKEMTEDNKGSKAYKKLPERFTKLKVRCLRKRNNAL